MSILVIGPLAVYCIIAVIAFFILREEEGWFAVPAALLWPVVLVLGLIYRLLDRNGS